MRNKRRYAFGYLNIAIALGGILLLVLFVVTYNKEKQEVLNNLDASVQLMIDGLEERLVSIDKLYYALELHVDNSLKEAILSMNEAYENGEISQEKLFDIQDNYENIDLYVIDESNVIQLTTYQDDLGLDFNNYERYKRFLEEIRFTHEYFSERVEISFRDSELRKYSYMATADGKYIMDASYSMNAFDSFLEDNSFKDFSSKIFQNNNFLVDLELYDSYNDTEARMMKLIPADEIGLLTAIKEVEEKKETVFYEKKMDGYTLKTFLIPYQIKHHKDVSSVLIYKMTSTNEHVLSAHNQEFYRIGLVLFISYLLLIGLTYYYHHSTLRPVDLLLEGFKEVRGRNFATTVEIIGAKPVREAIYTFNDMVANIQSLIDQKELVEDDLRRHLRENEDGYLNTVSAMATAIEAKDLYTGGHCERVMNMSLLVSEYIGHENIHINQLMYASLLHDIGKIGIEDRILNKEGRFTNEEYEVMKLHPEIGHRIVSGVPFLEESSLAILHHHERYDGNGYPAGLSGENIPYMARLLCITDAFDAMTSRRIYKSKVMTIREAFDELKICSGTQFDGQLVEQFILAYQKTYGTNLDRYADEIE
jgi:HD-GYP domain-containing protein (c-di-GMP phosphodiesterase class II)